MALALLLAACGKNDPSAGKAVSASATADKVPPPVALPGISSYAGKYPRDVLHAKAQLESVNRPKVGKSNSESQSDALAF